MCNQIKRRRFLILVLMNSRILLVFYTRLLICNEKLIYLFMFVILCNFLFNNNHSGIDRMINYNFIYIYNI